MRIRSFDYWEAPSLDEALTELEVSGADAKVIAGGTDLVLNMKKKIILPRRVISLHNLNELDFVKPDDSRVRIGALTKHADLAADPFLKQHLPILCEAVGLIGSWQIRNVGTIGGNLCNASPAADSAPPLLVLDAQLILASKTAEKKIAKFRIKGEPESKIESLSGGNQQRLLLSFLPDVPGLLLLGNPTRGLDMESVLFVWQHLHQFCEYKACIVFSSSELDEILMNADRVLVFFNGVVVKDVRTDLTDAHELGRAIAGKA